MMFDYNSFADMVGTSVKAMWSPLLPEKAHRDAFNNMVDAKVALNKGIYNASKDYATEVSNALNIVTKK